MRTNKCKHNKRECKVEGCTSTEFYDTCNNMCKTHKIRSNVVNKKKCRIRLLKSLCPVLITAPEPTSKKLTLRF